MNKPIVSVCMITYNQELYILKSIQSAINQKTNFDYEIIIADDKSTDNTSKLLEELAKKNCLKISLISNKVNIGASKNLLNVLKKAKGKYIAILEGDDYWQDTNKLQSCFDFMENNMEFSVIHHKVNVVTNENLIIGELPKFNFRNNNMSLESLILKDSFMATCSIFFRNYFMTDLYLIPESITTIRNMADWPLNVFLATRGKIGYININMASYRVASGKTSWSKRNYSEILLDAIKINTIVNKELSFKYDKIIKTKIIEYYLAICVDYLFHLRFKKFINTYNEIKVKDIEKISFILKSTLTKIFLFYYGAFKMLFIRINKKFK